MDAEVDVVVIGAGQAGLSAAHHLRRLGIEHVVLDAERGPGGAWRHRWENLRMRTVNGIFELPGMALPEPPPSTPAREALPAYFAAYELREGMRVERPVRVRTVTRDDDRLRVAGGDRTWRARYVVNATGTWTRPFIPAVPGAAAFRGRQVHVHDYRSAEDFRGARVAVVGAGISAIQILDELSAVTSTLWVTRREPQWIRGEFDEAARIAAIAGVDARVRDGEAPGSIVSITGMVWSPFAASAERRGALVRHPMFTAIEPGGVRMPDGTFEPVDAILWATGFRAELRHLAPLRLTTAAGGIRVVDTRAVDEPRLFVIGYGPSQSTVGANRAGRTAARLIDAELD